MTMNERRAIRIAFDEGQQASCFDAETGRKLLNVYRVELLFDRRTSQARVVFGESMTPPNATRTEVFDVLSVSASFTGVVSETVYGPAYYKLSSPTLKFVTSDVEQRFTKESVTGVGLADDWRDFGGAA